MEWVFRVSWVLMVTYLPSIFANEEITILKVEIRWELYFVVIFLFILLWDVIMIDKIIKHSKFVARNKDREEESISELKKIWRKYDIFLFLSAAFVYINGALPWAKYGDYINYKLPIFFVLISTMFGICIVQLSRWSREIYLSLKTIEVGSSP
jgi:hypothetical protein